MPRRSALDDRTARNRFLIAVADGCKLGEAADAIGTTRQSVHRYGQRNPEFAEALENARTTAERKATGGMGGSILAESPPEPVVRPPAKPSPDAEAVAEMIGVDADLVMEADLFVESEAEMSLPEGCPPLTVKNYFRLCWERMWAGGTQGPMYGRLIQPAMIGSTVRAQERREAAKARQEQAAEQRAIAAEVTAGSDPAGSSAPMMILEAPYNPAREFLRKNEVVEAEVLDG
jgi:hypothetical protein